jgi:hypothetical protein
MITGVRDLGGVYPAGPGALPEYNGRHFWMILAMFRVANPAREEFILDRESVVTVDGPSCLHCEQPWSPTMGAKCPGDPGPAGG